MLCWPIYDFNPGTAITSQIHRIGNLHGTNTIVVAVGGGLDPLNASSNRDKTVQNANETVTQTIKAFRGSDNLDIQGIAGKITP
jgi:hypothetical protein